MGHQSFSEKSQTRQVLQLIFDHLAEGSGVTLTQANGILTITATGGGGTVASVGVSTGTSGVSVTGSPVTTSGTIDLDLGTLANVDDAPADGSTYGRKNNAWVATGGGFEPSTAWDIYEEFIWSGINDGGRWQVVASGPGNTAFRSEHRHPGIRVLRSTGVGGYSAATSNKLFVGGATAQTHEFVFRIPVLGSATQRFSTTIGLAEDYVSGTGENLRLLYIDSINSGAFTLRATVGGVVTDYLSTSVFAAAGTWYHGKIVLDGTGQAFAYVNGVLIATATSLPSAAMYASATFYKTVATGADPGTELELDMFHSFGSR